MIKGKGSLKPIVNGLRFESRTSTKNLLSAIPGYSVNDDEIFYKGTKVAHTYSKNKFYSKLLAENGIDNTKIISKRLLPDDAILIQSKKTLFIIEVKFQEVAGSVDEKLQTCAFKIQQYRKLVKSLGLTVRYVYVLSDWFRNPSYNDVLDYVEASGCNYFFNEIPLNFLGLPVPSEK